jgi:hypothetical protein
MVTSDFNVDFHGVPEEMPSVYFHRFPLWKRTGYTGTGYGYGKQRMQGKNLIEKMIHRSEVETEKLATELDRIKWERELRERPRESLDLSVNTKIVDILGGELIDCFVNG